MRIACMIFASMRKMGGAQVFAFNLLGKLTEFGETVTLYLMDNSYKDIVNLLEYCPFRVKPLVYKTYRISVHAPQLMKQLVKYIQKKEKYDLWQVIGAYPAGYIASTLKRKVPLVLRAHGEDIQKNIKLNYGCRIDPAVEQRIKKTVNSMDKVIAMTENMYDCYRELQVPIEKIVEIPNTVNTKRFRLPTKRTATRARHNIPLDTTLLITIGRYHIKKGHDLIPSIADSLRKKGVNFKWLLIGNGLSNLQNEIAEKELSDYIILRDEISISDAFDKNGEIKIPDDELIRLLKSADIFVFPTRLEGFPMVLIESMAAGVPIVTTDSPGVREVVIHNKTALLSTVDDIDSIVSNIILLIKDNKLRKNLIQEGQKELFKYDVNNIAKQYLELYTQLINGRSG